MVRNFFYIEGIENEEELRDRLNKKKKVHGKYINSKDRYHFNIKRRIIIKQHNLPTKAFIFEELEIMPKEIKDHIPKYEVRGDIEHRFGYYVISPQTGRWIWGQYCPFIPPEDFKLLIEKAKEHGFI